MDNGNRQNEIKKADTTFYSNINIDGIAVENILCKLYLPLKITDSIEFHFQLTDEQAKVIQHLSFWEYSVEGEVRDLQGEIKQKISSNAVFSDKLWTTYHSLNLNETHFVGKPQDLMITNFLDHHTETQKVEGHFWITPNPLLRPAMATTHSYTGEIKIKIARNFNFDLREDTRLYFENYYKYYNNEDGDTVSFYELVSRFEKDNENNGSLAISEILKQLDDILLLASFAARKKCVCLGLDSYDSKTLQKKYLRDRIIPENISEDWDREDSVINLSNFEEFMRTAFVNFQNYEDIEALRLIFNFITPIRESTVDKNFIGLYSALEMIVLHFRRKHDCEFILPPKKFEKVRKKMKDYIDNLDLLEDSLAKTEMKNKLSELNRISFASVFEQFCKFYSIDLTDLWSVTTNKEGTSLIQLRNKLVHGEKFNNKHYTALIIAREHLQWTIERMILAILGWSVEKSNLNSASLSQWSAYLDWREYQI